MVVCVCGECVCGLLILADTSTSEQASDSDDDKGEEGKLGTPRKDKGKEKGDGDGNSVQDGEPPAVLQFVEFLISLLKTVRRNLRHSAQYFNLLYDFVLTSLEEKKYFLARHIVREYIEFYLQTGKFAPVALRRGTKDVRAECRAFGCRL